MCPVQHIFLGLFSLASLLASTLLFVYALYLRKPAPYRLALLWLTAGGVVFLVCCFWGRVETELLEKNLSAEIVRDWHAKLANVDVGISIVGVALALVALTALRLGNWSRGLTFACLFSALIQMIALVTISLIPAEIRCLDSAKSQLRGFGCPRVRGTFTEKQILERMRK